LPDDIGLWRLQQIDCRRKRRDIWIRYEVSQLFETLPFIWRGFVLTETRSLAMTASQMRIAETIDAFYGEAGTRDGVSRSYKQAVEDLDAETIKALDGPYRYDCG
jgi:hypothetical protein